MLGDLLKAIELLGGKISELDKQKNEKIETTFKIVVESSYKDLELIHRDYSMQLSKLRDHLIGKSLPPRELIQWFRNAGLEYRDKREALQTIKVELDRFTGKPVNPNKDKESKFNWHLQRYIKAVLAYMECTISYQDLSYYRDYERSLNSLLGALEKDQEGKHREAQVLTSLFYESDFVQDLNEQLIKICDEWLPRRWKIVVEEYRLLRDAL
jgi:hypothetical protein